MTSPIHVSPDAQPGRRRLYIHIGAYKTGTTSIQYLLDRNRQHLHGHGVYYPSTGRHPRAYVQHGLLAEAFLERPQVDPDRQLSGFGLQQRVDGDLLVRALRHEIDLSGCHTVILSSEVFYSLPESQIPALFSYFPDYDIVPILYIRNLVDMAETFYQTALIYGNLTCTFDEYQFDLGVRVDLHDLCQQWAAGALNGKILVQDYDVPGNRDVIPGFRSLVGIADKPINTNIDRQNLSFSPAIVTLVRELRRLKLSEARIQRSVGTLAGLEFAKSETVIPEATRRRLHERYREEYRKLLRADFVEGLLPEHEPSPLLPPKDHISGLPQALRSAIRAKIRMRRSGEQMRGIQNHHHPSI